MKNRSLKRLNIGSSIIVTIFVILCMTVFSLLSYVSVTSEYQLAKKLANRTSQYAMAYNTAEEILSKIDCILYNCYINSDNKQDYYNRVNQSLLSKNNEYFYDGNSKKVSYITPINEIQGLLSEILIEYPEIGKPFYKITSWNTITLIDWKADNHINVYNLE